METNKKTNSAGDVLTALTIALLFLVILLLVVFTAKAYQHSTDSQYDNDNRRVLCAYVATAVKDHDAGEITPNAFGAAPGLRIDDGDTGFSHKIYLWGGNLMEEYSKTEAPINPKAASKIGQTSLLEITYIDDDLLEVKTDQGASYVNVQR